MGNLATWFFFLSIILLCMNVKQFTAGAKFEGIFDNDASIFGPYIITTQSIEKCQMPGPIDTERECINNVTRYKMDGNKEELRGIIVVPQDIANLAGEVEIWKKGAFKPLVNKKFKNACAEGLGIFVRKFITTDQNCSVKKGNYTVDILDPHRIIRHLIGESFFYTKIVINVALYSKKGLVSCVKLNIESKPLPKNT